MKSEQQQDNPKGLKAMLTQVKASLFSPVRTEEAVALKLAQARVSTEILDGLDAVLSRSKAAQIQRETKQ